MKKIWNSFRGNNPSLNNREEYYAIKTFTYFIPAPPNRQKGYREREFDKLIFELGKRGHDVLNIEAKTLNTDKSSGLWVIVLLGATTKQAAELDLEFDEKFGLDMQSDNGDIIIEN
jgi:hypothetical protein